MLVVQRGTELIHGVAGARSFRRRLCLVPLQETDVFFRLANGQEILRTGHVPGRNLFSFTFPDQPYLDSAWLFDLATAGLYRVGGFPAVVVGKTVVVVATFVAAYLLLRRRGSGRVIAALVLAAAAFCMRERLVERPHVVSLLGEVVVLALLPALQDGRRRAWLLVPVVALWANLHAGAFAGPVLVTLAGLGVLLDGIISPSLASRRAVVNHALAAILCTLALMATPAGSGIFRYLAFHADIFAVHPVDEFRRPAWHSDAPLVIYAVALALSLGLCAARRVRPRARDLLPVLGLALLAGRYVRFGPTSYWSAPFWPRLSSRPWALAGGSPRRTAPISSGPPAPCSRCWHSCLGWRMSSGTAASWTSISTARICPWRRWVSLTSTACANGCTTTSRPAPF